MLRCPQCGKPLSELSRRCPHCQADLDLLVDLAGQMRGKLDQAEALTRQGDLGKAVWAYLEVLEADPGNPAARKEVAHIATAVRQFDLSTPARRWVAGMPIAETWWEKQGKIVTAAVAALALGLLMGLMIGKSGKPTGNTLSGTPTETKDDGKKDAKDDAGKNKDAPPDPKTGKEPKTDSINADPKKKDPNLNGLNDPKPPSLLDRSKLGLTPDEKK